MTTPMKLEQPSLYPHVSRVERESTFVTPK
jgi:hypothetical protein